MGIRFMATARQSAIALMFAGMTMAGSASATLMDRGGGMIYDEVLHITWLQDANYAQTQFVNSGGALGDADGLMTWSAANAWAANLVYGGYSDWRLATTDLTSPTTSAHNCSVNATACAANGNELGYMYWINLGSGDNTGNQTVGVGNDSFTLNDIQLVYWSGTEWGPNYAWVSHFADGIEGRAGVYGELSAWAVRDGDAGAAVPEPASLLLAWISTEGNSPNPSLT